MSFFITWLGTRQQIDKLKDIHRDFNKVADDVKAIEKAYHEKLKLVNAFTKDWEKGKLKLLTREIERIKILCVHASKSGEHARQYELEAVKLVRLRITDMSRVSGIAMDNALFDEIKQFEGDLALIAAAISEQLVFFDNYGSKITLVRQHIDTLIHSIGMEGKALFTLHFVNPDHSKGLSLLEKLIENVPHTIQNHESWNCAQLTGGDNQESLIAQACECVLTTAGLHNARALFVPKVYAVYGNVSNYRFLAKRYSFGIDRIFALGCARAGEKTQNIRWVLQAVDDFLETLSGGTIYSTPYTDFLIIIGTLKRLEPNNIDHYTLKARLCLEHPGLRQNEFINSAIQDLALAFEKCVNRSGEENIAILKLKSRMRALKLRGHEQPTPEEKEWRRLGNLFSADDAYPIVRKILDNLDQVENRKTLAEAFQKAGYKDIDESDFVGARISKLSREQLERSYGIRVYPITIGVPKEKWEILKGRRLEGVYTKLGVADWSGGINISGKKFPYPFNHLGGLRILMQAINDPHEDFHGSFELYEYSDDPLVNELFAYRANVEHGQRTWESVGKILKEKYIPYYYPNSDTARTAQLASEIDAAIQTIQLMQDLWPKIKVTRVLLKCKTLREIIAYKPELISEYQRVRTQKF